jgi:hypothetical protein
MYVTYRYPDTEVARRNVTAYIDRTRDIMTSVSKTGTYEFARQITAERELAA